MDLGSIELQIFVSLTVVLGAAFVALVCDYLKGNNEQLREHNIELRVRKEEGERFALLDPRGYLAQFFNGTSAADPGIKSGNPAVQTAGAGSTPMEPNYGNPGALQTAAQRTAALQARSGEFGQDSAADVPPMSSRRGSASSRRRDRKAPERPAESYADWVRPEVIARVARRAEASISAHSDIRDEIETLKKEAPEESTGKQPLNAPDNWDIREKVNAASKKPTARSIPAAQQLPIAQPVESTAPPQTVVLGEIEETRLQPAEAAQLQQQLARAASLDRQQVSPSAGTILRPLSFPALKLEEELQRLAESETLALPRAAAVPELPAAPMFVHSALLEEVIAASGNRQFENVAAPAVVRIEAPFAEVPMEPAAEVAVAVEMIELFPAVTEIASAEVSVNEIAATEPAVTDPELPTPAVVLPVVASTPEPEFLAAETALASEHSSMRFELASAGPMDFAAMAAEAAAEFVETPPLPEVLFAEVVEPPQPWADVVFALAKVETAVTPKVATVTEEVETPIPLSLLGFVGLNVAAEGSVPNVQAESVAEAISLPGRIELPKYSLALVQEQPLETLELQPARFFADPTSFELPSFQAVSAATDELPFWRMETQIAAEPAIFMAAEPATLTALLPIPINIAEHREMEPVVRSEPAIPDLLLPAGMHSIETWNRLLSLPNPMSGILFTISLQPSDARKEAKTASVGEDLGPATEKLMASFVRDGDFGCQIGNDEWVFIYSHDPAGFNQRRVGMVSEKLWDFQLRHLGMSSSSFKWGAVDVKSEGLGDSLSAARDRMDQSRRARTKTAADIRLPRKVANG